MRVVVIGAGLAGLSVAHELVTSGAEVTVLDRAAGPGMETSFANGALLHPSFVDPWNAPGILSFLLRNLGRQQSPMLLRLAAIPSLLTWGLGFIRASSQDRSVRAKRLTTATLHRQYSPPAYPRWRQCSQRPASTRTLGADRRIGDRWELREPSLK